MRASWFRLLITLALAGVALVVAGSPAQACTCQPNPSVERQAQRADVVFSGVLREQRNARRADRYTFDVERVYRGRVAETPAEVRSTGQRSACGLGKLRVDRAYVVFATESNARLETAQCTGTARATPTYVTDVEDVLGAGNRVPQASDPAPEAAAPEYTRVDDSAPPEFTRTAAPGAAMLLIGLLGLIVVSLSRRRRS